MISTRACLAVALMSTACGSKTLSTDPEVLLANALATCPECPANTYAPSDGFVVHEWGTLTSVSGSDGVRLPGLHHEEEDLPGFVADRVAQVSAYPDSNTFEKMETPVIYFYSPEPQVASVSVSFNNGLLTQWFPWVKRVSPPVYNEDGTVIDSWLSSSMSLPQSCAAKFSRPLSSAFSTLDWGEVKILGRSERPALAGPIGDATWGSARNVASNALAVTAPDEKSTQYEQFLFYRGLGDFQMPVTATVRSQRCAPDLVTFTNTSSGIAGRVLLMQVTKNGAAFVKVGDVGAGPVDAQVPTELMPMPEFVAALKAVLMESLVADGLFTDEAKAMVDTWERSYFLTPGLRALYLLPQADTDAIIPLTITPAPRVVAGVGRVDHFGVALKRTMVIRLELLTPQDEFELLRSLAKLTSGSEAAAGRAELLARGRFAEPHLTRAIALSTDAQQQIAGEALLREIRGVRRWAPITAE